MLMQVLAMAPEQINMLPQTERDAIMSLVRPSLIVSTHANISLIDAKCLPNRGHNWAE